MNRRGFLAGVAGGLAALAAGAELDPERLLWRRGAKLISIPPAPIHVAKLKPIRYAVSVSIHEKLLADDCFKTFCASLQIRNKDGVSVPYQHSPAGRKLSRFIRHLEAV